MTAPRTTASVPPSLTPAAPGLPPSARLDLASWPKAELHLHLDGSIRIDTALELARTRDVGAPRDEAGMRSVLVAPAYSSSQADLLRAFELPVRLLQDRDALERVAAELVETKAADGVRYAEIRWAPTLHLAAGLSIADVIAAVADGTTEGIRRAAAAGHPIVARLIVTAMRSADPETNLELAEAAGRSRALGVVGWDLAGPEERFPNPLDHVASFDTARAAGLLITCHAGEWGGAAQVRRALALRPERIAHGSVAADDPDLCDELRDRGIALDLCPTSNVQAGIVADIADHPLALLHRRGVPVTLSTDDLTVADVTLTEEYRRAIDAIGLTPAELWTIDRHALDVAFADEATLAPLRVAFDAWGAAHPELVG
jgi:adenosine deaminase